MSSYNLLWKGRIKLPSLSILYWELVSSYAKNKGYKLEYGGGNPTIVVADDIFINKHNKPCTVLLRYRRDDKRINIEIDAKALLNKGIDYYLNNLDEAIFDAYI